MSEFDSRLAFPTSDNVSVDEHFGHARNFAFVDIKENKVVNSKFVTPPPHAPGTIPKFVADNGATAIITGGMGAMAVNIFTENNVNVILGYSGTIEQAISSYINGGLASTGSACDHDHGDHDHHS